MNENLRNMPMNEQEQFWSGAFGDNYIERNESSDLLASNIAFFSKVFCKTRKLSSICEFGSNVGMNMQAISALFPEVELYGVEINRLAFEKLQQLIGPENAYNCSIADFNPKSKVDLAFTKGVLIHINPSQLLTVYQKLYEVSHRYILIAEYYDPKPAVISYRGHEDRLFKRDFAGELLDIYSDLHLVCYGFSYHRDTQFPQDDISWFLLEKN